MKKCLRGLNYKQKKKIIYQELYNQKIYAEF